MRKIVIKTEPPAPSLPRQYVVYHFRAPTYRTRSWHRASLKWSVFSVLLSGSAETEWEEHGQQRRLTVTAGDVMFWGRHAPHWEANVETPGLAVYNIAVEWAPPEPGLPHVVHDPRGWLRVLAAEMLAVALDDLPAVLKRQLLDGCFLTLVAEYRRLATVRPHPMVDQLRLFTKEHIAEPFRVTDLARHFGLGERHFQWKYKSAAGRTPMAEVRWIRAEHARTLILNVPELPLKEVARRVGLRDHRHLDWLVKRCYGVRPRDLPRLKPAASHRAIAATAGPAGG